MNHKKLIDKNREASPDSYKFLREKKIVKEIRDELKISENEESALFRKTLKYILDIIRELHDGEIDTEKFMKHYNDIESIIAKVDAELEGTEEKT